MITTGTTRVVGIFGDPIEHSLSPVIQNAAFAAAGLDYTYVPFHVIPKDLAAAVQSIRALDLAGVNITIPHKEAVLPLIDQVDDVAEEIGAVNTIINRKGRLVGYNTDGVGYLLSLRDELGFTPRGKNIVIIGAGGAARAIFYTTLLDAPASVVVANRTPERAKALIDEFSPRFPEVAVSSAGLGPGLSGYAASADLVVNTTSLGMMGAGEVPLPFDALSRSAIVSDIVYKPLETPLITQAEELGLRTHKGLGMLIRQGAVGFELWTGRAAPVEIMRMAAMAALGLTDERPDKGMHE